MQRIVFEWNGFCCVCHCDVHSEKVRDMLRQPIELLGKGFAVPQKEIPNGGIVCVRDLMIKEEKGAALSMDWRTIVLRASEKNLLKTEMIACLLLQIFLVEGLKKANISSVSKDGKALKFSEMLKLLPASETGKAVSRRLKILNLAQVAGYLYSGLVLGIGIPKLNIYMTNKSEAKRKARLAEKKALEAKQMSQLSQAGADASKLEFLQPNMNKFLNK